MSNKNKNAAKKGAAPVKETVENKNVETTQQVADKSVTNKEEKDKKPKEQKPAPSPAPEKQKENKANADKKPAEKSSTQKPKKDKTPTVIAEEVHEGFQPSIPIGKEALEQTKYSSTDAKARLVEYGFHRFVNNQAFKDKYPEQYNAVAQSVDAVWLLAMVDVQNELSERISGGELIAKVSPDQIMPLQEVAGMLGITLATPKVIEAKDGSKQLEIDFSKTEIPEELRNAGGAPKEAPDLDPKKPRTAEELADVLYYLMRDTRNIAVALVNTVEWYRKNRIEQAGTADGKLAVDNKSVEELIKEIFNIIDVTKLGIFRGLGSTVYMYTNMHGSPIAAHALLHAHMSKCGWGEEDIASACKALIQENFRLKTIENKDLQPKDNKAIRAIVENIGNDYIDSIFANAHATVTEENKDKENEIKFEKDKANKILQLVRANYFPSAYKPTDDELRMKIGQIINLYRDPMERLAEYENGNMIGEYPQKKEESDSQTKEEKPATEEKPANEKKN